MELALVSISIVLLCCIISYIFYDIYLKAKLLRKKLQKQGIDGPVPSLVLGNLPDIQKIMSMSMELQATCIPSSYNSNVPLSLDCRTVLIPHICQWTKQYAKLLRKKLQKQGIDGPVPSLVLGNLPDIQKIMSMSMELQATCIPSSYNSNVPLSLDCRTVLIPHICQWTKQYGKTFSFAIGKEQIIYTSDAGLLRDINCCTSLDLGKPAYLQKDRGPLLGKGILTSSRQVWAHQRRTIAPFLYPNKVKNMLGIVLECGGSLVKILENIVETEGGIADIGVDDHVKSFTSAVISAIMFRSHYPEKTTLFTKFRDLTEASGSPTVLNGHPFYSYFPTKKNREQWRLAMEIYSIIKEAAKKYNKEENMIQTLVKGAEHSELGASTRDEFIVDNCKDICLAAMDVVGNTAIWGLMLLASHPEWQAHVRAEILQVCGGINTIPDADKLNKMRVLKMTIQEILRLYPAAGFITREALADVQLGKLCIPKGVNIWTWPIDVHRDTNLWGEDSLEFKPERFVNGISGACKVPQAYMPFGLGPRICPGKNLGSLELTVLFALILQRFSISLSPNYQHVPRFDVLLEPKYGLNLLIRKL